MRNLIVASLCCLCASLAHGGDFETANQAYDEGRYAEAKATYQKLVTAGDWTANLFYNLGNTEYRLGANGEAIVDYARALSLEPGHPEARSNLNFLRAETGAIPWQMPWIEQQLPSGWASACAIIAALATWSALFLLVRAFVLGNRSGTWIGLAVAVLVGGFSFALVWRGERDATRAIVIAKAAEARLAPAVSAGAAGVLPAGSEVRVLNERGEWIYCALPTGGRGWIAAKDLARVKLTSS